MACIEWLKVQEGGESMSVKKNPYQYLLEKIKNFCAALQYRHTITMFVCPKKDMNTIRYDLLSLYQRVKAAEQLGYDVELTATDEGLVVKYKKKIPDIPWDWWK